MASSHSCATVPIGLIVSAAAALVPQPARAQGCMPMRLASQVVGGIGDVYLPRRTWQLGLGYRRATSDQLIVGHEVRNDLAVGGQPSVVKLQSVNLSAAYGVTDRLSVTLNVPFSSGSHVTTYPDQLRHENTSTGLGEVTLVASWWLRAVHSVTPSGNLALGLGVKAPTGKHDVQGRYWLADGSSVAFPVHQSIQLGDGGWGIIVEAQGFQPVLSGVNFYAAGSYTINPKAMTEVVRTPGSRVPWAVPDTWDTRAGAAWVASPDRGVSFNLGGRLGGTTREDLIGGKDPGFRLPAIAGYLDPGLVWMRGANTLTMNVPMRVFKRFRPSYVDQAAGKPGGGGLSRYLIQASYSRRF